MPTYTEHDFFEDVAEQGYKYGFTTNVESEKAPKGLSEDTVRFISAKKNEPEWLLEFRLKALRHFFTLLEKGQEPDWAHLDVPSIDYQDAYYYAAPGKKARYESLDDVPPEILADFERLGIPLGEQARLAGVAVDAVMDSVSVATTFKEELAKQGIIFCSFSEAVENHPDLVREYMGSVVPYTDNLYAALNSAVFSDGSFCYIPKGVRCPMELSTYFRINEANTGQFERTLIICEDDGYVSYMEGCTAPMREEYQLHAAIVEIVAKDRAEVKYSTIQNWYPGSDQGKGGVYNSTYVNPRFKFRPGDFYEFRLGFLLAWADEVDGAITPYLGDEGLGTDITESKLLGAEVDVGIHMKWADEHILIALEAGYMRAGPRLGRLTQYPDPAEVPAGTVPYTAADYEKIQA
ncbi:MAG TPA: hypothetical protein EYQ24_14675, partial [Bacteroidetes bacterium]|nr:hypothetical protein [Bacteroidota bacterium]